MLRGSGAVLGARKERAHAREDRRRGLAGELLVDDRLCERDEQAARPFELHAKGARGIDDARERGVGRAQVRERGAGIEAERTVAVEQPELAVSLRTFDREQPELRRDAAVGGEAADLSPGREHAMARHDDRERVSPQGLAHGARRAGRAEPCRDVAVRERGTRRYRARDLVDAAVEGRHAAHVECDGGEIAGLAAQERADGVERAPHVGGGAVSRASGNRNS